MTKEEIRVFCEFLRNHKDIKLKYKPVNNHWQINTTSRQSSKAFYSKLYFIKMLIMTNGTLYLIHRYLVSLKSVAAIEIKLNCFFKHLECKVPHCEIVVAKLVFRICFFMFPYIPRRNKKLCFRHHIVAYLVNGVQI